MKTLITIFILLASTMGFSQVGGVIINQETKENIPFVNIWVKNENIGTTSDDEGRYNLKIDTSKVIVFSAVGFETKTVSSDSIIDYLELKPSITVLKEIVVRPAANNEKLLVGQFKKSDIKRYFACRSNPWIVARYFEFEEEFYKTPFLDNIRVTTRSDIKGAKFNIRLYSVDEAGKPDQYLCEVNLFGTTKKGKKINEIDLSDLNIEFPINGLFVAFEWLIINSNEYRYKANYIVEGTQKTKEVEVLKYTPSVGILPADKHRVGYAFTQGVWRELQNANKGGINNSEPLLGPPAIELTLTK